MTTRGLLYTCLVNDIFTPGYYTSLAASDWTVTAGDYNFTVEEDFEQKVKVKEIYLHPEYSYHHFKNVSQGIDEYDNAKNDVGKILSFLL